VNTRFNPTVNGDPGAGILHLGHLYMCLVNEYMAHSTGGRFIVRFDDNQADWLNKVGQTQMWRNAAQIRDELDWCGIKVDEWAHQSTTERSAQKRIDAVWPGLREPNPKDYLVPHLTRSDAPQYPYAAYLTAEVILNDHWGDVDLMIAGDELLDRYALYCWMSDQLGVKQIEHVYLPRLTDGAELAPVSKTEGNHRLMSYRRDTYTPAALKTILANSCLDDPAGAWDWRNVKREPRLTI
jgi:glutamyl/glutaminyl-tRNA synthetase